LVETKRKLDPRQATQARDFETQQLIQDLVLKLRLKIGKQVQRKHGNAIISYMQFVEFEETGKIAVRGYGTGVVLTTSN